MNPTPRANQFWLIVLAALWAFYGLVGRDAWKGEEALALAAVLDWLAGTSSAWATPAPLYTLVAGLTAQLASGHWDVQDGARLASGVFTLLALLFAGMTARSLHGPGHGAAAVLALIGCMGLMLRVHALLPETALLAGWSALLYGVAV
ncbi:MAG: glycosyltransferase family 39 protein, partial [Betaproteobacteria bacterium]|nr:glycosyltransferase family 39 protein [Betaproteobacteria bacterium]